MTLPQTADTGGEVVLRTVGLTKSSGDGSLWPT